MRKYHNTKVTIDGICYDSRKEYRRFQELLSLEKEGVIQDLKRQVKFILIPAQYEPDTVGPKGGVKKGKIIERECAYLADFVYRWEGELIVEDTKSEATKTKDYIIKRKLMYWIHGIRIREV